MFALQLRAFGERTLVVEDTTSASNLFDFYRVYAKGAIVLHMLRWVVNDDAVFKNILRSTSPTRLCSYGVCFHRRLPARGRNRRRVWTWTRSSASG